MRLIANIFQGTDLVHQHRDSLRQAQQAIPSTSHTDRLRLVKTLLWTRVPVSRRCIGRRSLDLGRRLPVASTRKAESLRCVGPGKL
jgi:hypothetical protein